MSHEYRIHDDGSFPCRRDNKTSVEKFNCRAYEEAIPFRVQYRA